MKTFLKKVLIVSTFNRYLLEKRQLYTVKLCEWFKQNDYGLIP